MVSNFIIAFGGTGARCAEALAYLYASRALSQPANILLIDPDAQNGNVSVTRDQLHRYHTVQHAVETAPSVNGSGPAATPLFNVRLNEQEGLEGFVWGYPNPNKPFSTLIGFTSQLPEHQRLLELMYDDQDLALQFDRGYVGHAHIGSLDLVRTLKRAIQAAADDENKAERDALQTFFRALRAAAHSDQANLFVIGSVFGGTGASGIPAIPALVSEIMGELRKKIHLGCAQVGPYFSFPESDKDRAPNSVIHALATQTALYHYAASETGYDRIYFMGSPQRDETNDEHAAGGKAQINRAHYVELAAALAAADFLEGAASPAGHTDVLSAGGTRVSWDKLPCKDWQMLRRRMVSFATFCQLYGDYLAEDLAEQRHQGARWTYDLREQTQKSLGGREEELTALKGFADRFLEWALELQETKGVELFTLLPKEKRSDRHLATIAAGARASEEPGRKIRFGFPIAGSVADNPYHFIIDRINRSRQVKQATAPGWFIGNVTQSVDEFCAANYATWWGNHER